MIRPLFNLNSANLPESDMSRVRLGICMCSFISYWLRCLNFIKISSSCPVRSIAFFFFISESCLSSIANLSAEFSQPFGQMKIISAFLFISVLQYLHVIIYIFLPLIIQISISIFNVLFYALSYHSFKLFLCVFCFWYIFYFSIYFGKISKSVLFQDLFLSHILLLLVSLCE